MQRTLTALAVAIVLVTIVFLLASRRAEPPPVVAALPEFELVERDGTTVDLAGLLGAPWVADFIFTRCVVYCPRITARMKELRERLPGDVRTVSFSVDPEHDTPRVLREYARSWGIEGREWLLLTGERRELWSLIREGFLQPVEETPEDASSPILHSNRFVLVDSRGRMRAFYDAFEEETVERLLRDLGALRDEEGR